MDASEFWCRAFLAAMGGTYAQEGSWDNHGGPANYNERAADAALAVAQRRGMVTGGAEPRHEPEVERVEFRASPADHGQWALTADELGGSVLVARGREAFDCNGRVVRIKWGETAPPKPIEVWIERKAGT